MTNVGNITNKKDSEQITSRQELVDYIRKSVDETEKYTDEEKAEKEAKIVRKLKMGGKLTKEELRFLQKVNPMLYAQAMRVEALAKAIEEQVKHARSKEEANSIVSTAVGGISKEDPAREYIVAAVDRISKNMRRSSGYSRLPNTEEEAKQSRRKRDRISFRDDKESEDNSDGFDISNWSPLQEIIDELPKFEAGA